MRYLLQPDPLQGSSAPSSYPYDNPSILHHMSDALHESVYRVSSLLISILPGLLAFVLALALLSAAGVLLSFLLRKALVAARFDERMSRHQASGIADLSPGHSPTALAGRVAFWGCVLLGLVIGISAFGASYSSNALVTASLLPSLSRLVGAILLLVAGNLLARFLARTVLIGGVNNQLQYARLLSIGVKWLVLVITAAMVLDHLGIGGSIVELAFGILFGGIVLTLALAVGLGSRDLVSRSLDRSGPVRPETFRETSPAEPRTDNFRHF